MKYIINFFVQYFGQVFEGFAQFGCLLMPLFFAVPLFLIMEYAPGLLPILIIGLFALPYLLKDK